MPCFLYDEDLNPPKKGTPQSRRLCGEEEQLRSGRPFSAQRNKAKAQHAATKVPSSAPPKNRLIKPKSSGYFYAGTTLCTTLLFLHHKAALSANGGRSIFLHKKAAERAAFGKEKMPSVSPQNGAKSVLQSGGGSLIRHGAAQKRSTAPPSPRGRLRRRSKAKPLRGSRGGYRRRPQI